MPDSVRPWVTAGIAVLGAGVIAVAPFEPAPPRTDVQIASSAVRLTTIPNPFEYYPQVVMRSLDNAGDRLAEYLADPLPIVTAIAENQYGAFADIVKSAGHGDVIAVATAIIRAIATPVMNLMKVAGSGEPFHTAASVIVRLALPIVSGVMAAGSGGGDVVKALADFDLVGAFSALTNIPARIVDGLLNGRVDAVGDEYSGLLAPVVEAPVADQVTGPFAFLIASLQEIGDTIAAPPPAPVGAGPVDTTTDTPAVTLTEPPVEVPAEAPAPTEDVDPKPRNVDPGTGDDPETGDDPAAEPPSAPGGSAEEDNEPAVPNAAPGEDGAEEPAVRAEDETPQDDAAETADSADAEAPNDAGSDDSSGPDAADSDAAAAGADDSGE